MSANNAPVSSRGFPKRSREDGGERATPSSDRVKVVGLDRALGDQKDLLFRRRFRVTKSLFVAPDRTDGAPDLVGKMLLGPSLYVSPIGQFHTGSPPSLPKWLYRTLAMWQYANMANSQIVYIRRVANDDQAPNRIKELRDAIGMTQVELARQASTTPSALNKVEKGSRKLDLEWMRRLAGPLGVTPADLLPVSDNPMMLDDQERDLIERFRAANRANRAQFSKVADAILPSLTDESSAA